MKLTKTFDNMSDDNLLRQAITKSIFRLFSGAISFVFQTRHNKEMKIYENNTLLSYLALTYILYTI